MELKFYIWLSLFMIGLGVWFYSNIQLGIDYERNPRLVDPISGAKLDHKDLLKLMKVLEYSEEYINQTNAEERLHNLVLFSNVVNTYVVDQSYTNNEDLIKSGWPVSNQTSCGYHLDLLLNQLSSNKNYTFTKGLLGYQMTNLMDSFGRPESGLYSGNIHWMGSYKRCMEVNLDIGNINTRYCIGRMRPRWWPQNETVYPATVIRMGLCLPETCDTLSFNHHKSSIEQLAKHQLTKFYQDGYEFVSMFCLPDERSPLRSLPTSGRIFIIVMGSWLSLVLFATTIHEMYYRKKKSHATIGMAAKPGENMCKNDHKGLVMVTKQLMLDNNDRQLPLSLPSLRPSASLCEKLCEALSLRCSLKTFKTKVFSVDYTSGQRVRVDLGILDWYKSMMTVCIVLGHSGYLNQNFSRHLGYKIEKSLGFLPQWGLSIVQFVDIFFLIFGLLSTYTLMRKLKTHQLGNPMLWLAVNARIFIRITPVYMVMYWYARSVSPYTNSGPWWDYGVDGQSIRGHCMQDPWWLSIPIFAVYRRLAFSMCVPPAWFIVSYLQIATLLPLVTYLIYKLPNNLYRFMFTGFVAAVSLAHILIQVAHMETLPPEILNKLGSLMADLVDKFEVSGFRSTFGRFGSVCIGCYTGYLLRQYEEGHIRRWPRWLEKRSTTIYGVLAWIVMINVPPINHIMYKTYGSTIDKHALLVGNLVRCICWPLLNAMLIVTLSSTLNHTVLCRFSSHTFWHSFNKLGLCIFLIHWEVLYVLVSSYEQAIPYGFMKEDYKNWTIGVFYSIFLAIALHLFVETPTSKITALMDDYLTKPRQPVERNELKREKSNVEPGPGVELNSICDKN